MKRVVADCQAAYDTYYARYKKSLTVSLFRDYPCVAVLISEPPNRHATAFALPRFCSRLMRTPIMEHTKKLRSVDVEDDAGELGAYYEQVLALDGSNSE